MEGLPSPSGSSKQTPRKVSSSSFLKDLWSVAREGSLSELDSALLLLKKNCGNINLRNGFGLTPLHIATWRNHLPIVKRLLAAGADPDARDGESGWSSLHRALHFGHLAVASILLQSGATLTVEDSKFRTPVDLLSGPVLLGVGKDSVSTEVFSWGSGTNYQLGTGNAHIQKLPCKVDALQGCYVTMSAAAKFHSVAVGDRGELYTWGFGRGGRLGHPDFDVHSGQAAVITPRQVTLGLGSRHVKAIAAAKHHTVIATESGEVFSWGSNREGQLGYTSVNTQSTPRRVSSLRSKIIAIAAGNKHTAAVAESGEVFTWGCNKEGQLGYGTSNSASNYTPRMVEYLKGKTFKAVSAAKYHTVVLGADGEVFTWGHRLVNPRRVIIARNIRKSGTVPLKFHRMERLHVAAVAAGMVHSSALTDDGTLFYWVSSDPDLRCQQMYSLCGKNIVSISAGKYWTVAVTVTGDVYMCDGKKYKDETPVPTRLHGVKRATSVSVGETHLLIVCALYHPSFHTKSEIECQKPKLEFGDEVEELDEDFMFNVQSEKEIQAIKKDDFINRPIPSLKSLCEEVAAEFLVEPRNAIQLLEIADSLEANDLREHCEEIAIHNLDFIFTASAPAIATASPEILAKLEKAMDVKSSELWSHRRLPTPTATFPAVIDSEEEHEDENGYLRIRENDSKPLEKLCDVPRVDTFLQSDTTDSSVIKQVRALWKKLQQIQRLEDKKFNGHVLDDQQIAKLQTKPSLKSALVDLGFPLETESKCSLSDVPDGKGNKKMGASRKQRRKSKQKEPLVEILCVKAETCPEHILIKGFPDVKEPQLPKEKVDSDMKPTDMAEVKEDLCVNSPRSIANSCSNRTNTNKASQQSLPKKKNKKGGLSMFLSGALDDTPREVTPPPPPTKHEGPAWGGVKVSKGATSFRDIQNEQSIIKDTQINIKPKSKSENIGLSGSAGQIWFSSLMPASASSPITVSSARVVPVPEGEKNTPPWSSAATSPVVSRPSLRDIQMQQEKKQQSIAQSPNSRISGFAVQSGQGSVSEAGRSPKDTAPNRWFKPEMEAPSSIHSIQIEERAMKDLKRFYSSVKLVKPPSKA